MRQQVGDRLCEDIKRYRSPFELETTKLRKKGETLTGNQPSQHPSSVSWNLSPTTNASAKRRNKGARSSSHLSRQLRGGGREFEPWGTRRSGRARKIPAWHGTVLALTYLMTVCAKQQESIMTEGVVFKHTETVGFGDWE